MFGDEEKRWLVVGICLNKVLTPVLRKVIEEEIPQLYDMLIQPPTNIHSQTFASHQECLSPSTLRLNYININNNKTQGSSKHLYDYSVKDDISLAKLFVKPPLASFTAFDESLDLSAVLSILCGSPNFVLYGIDIIASDVRAKVRNEWGHCLFTTWNEAYYDECFQLMEDLIKTLKLAVTSEAKVLEDLKEWKKRGIEMCFEESISHDILELIQTEMATLVKSVEDNKESWMQDQVVLKDKLQNLTQVFGTEIEGLEAKHTALRSGFQRLESRQDDLEVKLSGLEQGTDKKNDSQTRDLLWKIPLVLVLITLLQVFLYENYFKLLWLADWYIQRGSHFKMILLGFLVMFLLTFLYEHYTRGSMLRYWYCQRGCLKGGRTVSFVYTTFDRQTPTVNGLEFSWESLKKKLNLDFEPLYAPGVHYYINTDRYAYGGVVTVRSSLDNTPQVRGAEVFALNAECTEVFYEESGSWKPYRSARNIRCTSAK